MRSVILIRFNKKDRKKGEKSGSKERWKMSLEGTVVQMSLKWHHGHKSGFRKGHPLNGSCTLGPVERRTGSSG